MLAHLFKNAVSSLLLVTATFLYNSKNALSSLLLVTATFLYNSKNALSSLLLVIPITRDSHLPKNALSPLLPVIPTLVRMVSHHYITKDSHLPKNALSPLLPVIPTLVRMVSHNYITSNSHLCKHDLSPLSLVIPTFEGDRRKSANLLGSAYFFTSGSSTTQGLVLVLPQRTAWARMKSRTRSFDGGRSLLLEWGNHIGNNSCRSWIIMKEWKCTYST